MKLGVLAQVEEPTPWVSNLAVATKKSGALRICIDPKHLNAALKREAYQLPILDDMLPELAQAKVFSTVDLKAGYWHCILDEESSLLTTFSTPYGRYRWLRTSLWSVRILRNISETSEPSLGRTRRNT